MDAGVERLARAHYRRRRLVARRAVAAALRRWSLVDPDDIAGSWAALLPESLAVVAVAQAASAGAADEYVAATSSAWGVAPSESSVAATAFSGWAADGRPLATLLAIPAVTVKQRMLQGSTAREALRMAAPQLALMVGNEVAQAGVNADQVQATATPGLGGYVRHVSLPACDRCVVLAGRWYRWSSGFARHPRCDCQMVPAPDAESGGARDPRQSFDAMGRAEQDRRFGKAQAQAIRDGADIGQVVNARRSTYSFGDGRQATYEGTTIRQGRAGRKMALESGQLIRPDGSIRPPEAFERTTNPRLTVRQIYRDAAGSRDEAVRLLRAYGYITDDWSPTFRRSNQSLLSDFGLAGNRFGAR